jgi:hypothetical protein
MGFLEASKTYCRLYNLALACIFFGSAKCNEAWFFLGRQALLFTTPGISKRIKFMRFFSRNISSNEVLTPKFDNAQSENDRNFVEITAGTRGPFPAHFARK